MYLCSRNYYKQLTKMKNLLIKELKKKAKECMDNPDIQPIDVVNDIIDLVDKLPDEETIEKKVDKWFPKKEHIDTLFKIYNTRQLTRDDKLVVLEIYNTFLDLIGEPRI